MVKIKNVFQLDKEYETIKRYYSITIIVKDEIIDVLWLG